MKVLAVVFAGLLLTACDSSFIMSQADKEEIANRACADILATRNYESGYRMKRFNEARNKVGKPAWSLTSEMLDFTLKYSSRQECIDLIL